MQNNHKYKFSKVASSVKGSASLPHSNIVIHEWLHSKLVPGVAGEEPHDGVPPPTHLGQQGQPGLPWSEGALLLSLLHQGLISENSLKLITGYCYDKHSKKH